MASIDALRKELEVYEKVRERASGEVPGQSSCYQEWKAGGSL